MWRTKPSFYTWENDGPEKVSGGSGVTQLEMHSEPSSADSQPRDPPTLTVPSPWWQRTEAGRHLHTLEGPRRERVPGLEESRRRVGSEALKAPVEAFVEHGDAMPFMEHPDVIFPHCGAGAMWKREGRDQ